MNLPSLCRITITNNELISCIASPSQLSDTKFVFSSKYEIKIPNTLFVENKDNTSRKICSTFKDFSDKTYIKFKCFDLDHSAGIIIPYYKSSHFICLHCNKIHDGKRSNKCCEMMNSPVKLLSAELYKITIPSKSDIMPELTKAKSEFIDLHFPDLLSTILLK